MTKEIKITEKYYNLYNIFKSTGWITPILFAFLTKESMINTAQILQISAVYILLPFFLEVPLGVFADRVGHKLVIVVGLFCQIMSCLALLILHNVTSYHLYLVFIYIAGSCFSGAETAFLYSHYGTSLSARLESYIYRINSDFYKYTIGFLIFGSVLYSVNPKIPIILQIFNFLLAIYFITKIKDMYCVKIKKTSFKESSISDTKIAFQFIFKDKKFLSIAIISAVFAVAIRINDKTIQPQILTYIDPSSYFLVGLIYAIGNIISSKSSLLFQKFSDKYKNKLTQYVTLIGLMGISFFAMSFENVSIILLGFLFLAFFKSAYRPLISYDLNRLIPFQKLHATIISCVALFGAIFSSVIHFISSLFFKNFSFGNICIGIILTAISLFAIWAYTVKNDWSILMVKSKLSKKKSYALKEKDKFYFMQIYNVFLKSSTYEFLEKKYRNLPNGLSISVVTNAEKFTTKSPMHKGHLLSDLNKKSQTEFIALAFKFTQKYKNYLHPLKADAPDFIKIFSESHEIYTKLQDQKYVGFIHGDLNPTNIIIGIDKKCRVIDWDASGQGFIWFDVLSLLTNPKINISFNERIGRFMEIFPEFKREEVNAIYRMFLKFKIQQMNCFGAIEKKFFYLENGYRHLLKLSLKNENKNIAN